MRDRRFIAVHRGGPLTIENHRALMNWAIKCSEHVLHLIPDDIDNRLAHALQTAKEWKEGKVKTGECMKASVAAHATARELSDPVKIAVARSIGQCVATAHMADHSMGAALYALKAVKLAGGDVEGEREWQEGEVGKLPEELVGVVEGAIREKREGGWGFRGRSSQLFLRRGMYLV